MSTQQPQEYRERVELVSPFQIRIVSYKLDGTYHCTVDNVDPGAVVARAEGKTKVEAEERAIARAKERLQRTRIMN